MRRSVMDRCVNTLHLRTKVQGVISTDQIRSEYYADPQEIENLKDNIQLSMHKGKLPNEQTGVVQVEKIIKDRVTFIRMYQTWDALNAFLCLKHKASFKLLAMLVDNLTYNPDNEITFDTTLFSYYKLTYQTYNKAVKDLMLSGILLAKKSKYSYTYRVNPNILGCGKVSIEDYISESKQKFSCIITDEEIMSKYNIRKSSVEDVATAMFGATPKTSKIGLYRSGSSDARVFFKLFRKKFSESLLNLKHLSSAKIIAYIIGRYMPRTNDETPISRTDVCEFLGFSKSTFYRSINDLIGSGLIYRDCDSSKYFFNPSKWLNGSFFKLIKSDFLTKKEQKKKRYSRYLNSKITAEIRSQFVCS